MGVKVVGVEKEGERQMHPATLAPRLKGSRETLLKSCLGVDVEKVGEGERHTLRSGVDVEGGEGERHTLRVGHSHTLNLVWNVHMYGVCISGQLHRHAEKPLLTSI
jgi:hypothetical protein